MENDYFSLKNKHIVITGASSGIGRQCVKTCSDLGADLTLIGRNEVRLKETLSTLEKRNHLAVVKDISESENLEEIIEEAVDINGKISGFIHSAGIESTIPFAVMNKEKYNEFFNINVVLGLELARIISKKKYLSDDSSSFIFIASVMGTLGQPGKVAYCASKGAILNAVKALSLELAAKKIRVNSISPGVVSTPMTVQLFKSISEESKDSIIKAHPLGIGSAEDVANAAAFLLSDASKWITGTNMIVDGGYSAQ